MKVAIYVRVSTDDQNVQMQIDRCTEYCKYSNYEVHNVYSDVGQSGMKTSRPAFNALLEDMRRSKFKAIVVYKIDRIGRSLQHLISLFSELKVRGVEFVSVTQNIDTKTPEGNMFMRMMMVLSEYERELTVDRVNEGIARARREGKTLGRPRVKVDKYAIIRLRNSGKSYRQIAKELNLSLGVVQRQINEIDKG